MSRLSNTPSDWHALGIQGDPELHSISDRQVHVLVPVNVHVTAVDLSTEFTTDEAEAFIGLKTGDDPLVLLGRFQSTWRGRWGLHLQYALPMLGQLRQAFGEHHLRASTQAKDNRVANF